MKRSVYCISRPRFVTACEVDRPNRLLPTVRLGFAHIREFVRLYASKRNSSLYFSLIGKFFDNVPSRFQKIGPVMPSYWNGFVRGVNAGRTWKASVLNHLFGPGLSVNGLPTTSAAGKRRNSPER